MYLLYIIYIFYFLFGTSSRNFSFKSFKNIHLEPTEYFPSLGHYQELCVKIPWWKTGLSKELFYFQIIHGSMFPSCGRKQKNKQAFPQPVTLTGSGSIVPLCPFTWNPRHIMPLEFCGRQQLAPCQTNSWIQTTEWQLAGGGTKRVEVVKYMVTED